MTLVYRFTDGSTAASVSGSGPFPGTPWDTGRTGVVARTRPTTRTGLYDELVAALIAAGFTNYNKSNVAGSKDDVFESTGESGAENVCIRLQQSTTARYILGYVAPKLNSSNDLEKAVGGATGTAHDRWDFSTSDFTSDFQILANKDYIWAVAQNTNHTAAMFTMFLGLLKPVDTNANTMILSAGVSAGDFVSVPVTGNPIALGYRPLDVVQIVNTPKASTARAETQVVVQVSTTAVVLRRLGLAYDSGARIGMAPVPIARRISQDVEFDNGSGVVNQFTSPFMPALIGRASDFAADNSLPSGQLLTGVDYALLGTHAQGGTEFGSGVTPNNRTLRFTTRTVAVGLADGNLMGKVPGLATYNGTITYYPHDYGREDRATPDRDYVPMRFTAASARNYMLGPTPGA